MVSYCSTHGKSSRGATGFRGVGSATTAGGTVADARGTAGGSGASGRGASPVGQPMGATTGRGRPAGAEKGGPGGTHATVDAERSAPDRARPHTGAGGAWVRHEPVDRLARGRSHRSEERRVGKECRCRWSTYEDGEYG